MHLKSKITHFVRQAIGTIPLPHMVINWLKAAVTAIPLKMHKLGLLYRRGPGF